MILLHDFILFDLTFFPFGKKETYFGKREEVFVPLPAPRVRSDPLFLWGSDVTGDGPTRFVVFVPPIFLHVWRDWGGVICLGGSNDVPDELTNGGVKTKKPGPAALRQSPRVGFRYPLACLSIDSTADGDTMGSAWGLGGMY